MRGLAERADRRTGTADEQIQHALAGGESRTALNLALRTLQSEAAKYRRRRPADASLADAELAGFLLETAAWLFQYKPDRPPGCPRVPRPEDLIYVYEKARLTARGDR